MTISALENALPAVLFDLDGTLVDPAGGISSGIAYALRVMDLAVPSDEVLAAMIGPKLSDSLLDYTDASPEQLPELIATYRTWYAEQGIAMGQAYPGIRTLLQTLRREGYALAVATQKPEGFARILLETHGLASFFDIIVGSSDDETLMPGDPGYRSGKTEIIAAALAGLRGRSGREPAVGKPGDREPAGEEQGGREQAWATAENAVMVGDRAQDVNGAAGNSLECIGVAWGFALPDELEAAGAIAVVGTAEALRAEVTRRLRPGSAVPGEAVPADAVPAEAVPADVVLAGAGGRSAGRGYPGEAPDGAL